MFEFAEAASVGFFFLLLLTHYMRRRNNNLKYTCKLLNQINGSLAGFKTPETDT